ncbi:MAG: hypothetical protein Q8O10_08395 [candidate division Zixibacteria bacterium]|nr:hypothetical protein [candidate division Zixibacteria bacterium]
MKVIFFKAAPFLGNKGLEKGLSRTNLDYGVHPACGWMQHPLDALQNIFP